MTTLPATKPRMHAERKTPHLPLYRVLLHNDELNTMEHVVRSLLAVFKFDRRKGEQIMIEAHRQGMALCALEPLEQAEHHRDQLISYSLVATIEKE